jgi:hypothetical protein
VPNLIRAHDRSLITLVEVILHHCCPLAIDLKVVGQELDLLCSFKLLALGKGVLNYFSKQNIQTRAVADEGHTGAQESQTVIKSSQLQIVSARQGFLSTLEY